MSKIRIKNFGPIKEGYQTGDGWLNVKKVTVFIGNQGSGKSTLAKVISTMTWLEKAINRGDADPDKLSFNNFYGFFNYQRIRSYFRPETEIEYDGQRIYIKYNRQLSAVKVTLKPENNYDVPKIMYVPAERNFLSVVRNPYGIKNLPDTLHTFAEELRKGQFTIGNNLLDLPFGGLKYKYKEETETSHLVGDGFELDLTESSSGYQSFVPLYLVTKFLSDELRKGETILREQLSVEQSVRRNKEISDVMFNNNLSPSLKEDKVKEIDAKYLNTCLVNIVEEPEQNLYPSSQKSMLDTLTCFNNLKIGNKLIITTHSPYLINYITLAVEAHNLRDRVSGDLKEKLNTIVPEQSTINPTDLAIYELDESGNIKLLESYKGIPSDENKLNDKLVEGNDLFAELLEIEQTL
jgi:predicted ATPase